jgi:hypothetical protein
MSLCVVSNYKFWGVPGLSGEDEAKIMSGLPKYMQHDALICGVQLPVFSSRSFFHVLVRT